METSLSVSLAPKTQPVSLASLIRPTCIEIREAINGFSAVIIVCLRPDTYKGRKFIQYGAISGEGLS